MQEQVSHPQLKLKLIFLFWCVLTFKSGFSQKLLKGQVINQSGEGISYANIVTQVHKYGLISDEKGFFTLRVSSTDDSVLFTSVGYEKVHLTFGDLLKNSEVILIQKVFSSNDFPTRDSKTIWVGYQGEKPADVTFNNINVPMAEIGLVIQKAGQYGYLKKIKVNAGFKGKPKLPFRINVYALNERGLPGENILKKSIIFKPGSGNVKWYEFDISDQSVSFPEKGLCISIAFLNPEKVKFTTSYAPVFLGFHKPGSVGVLRTTWQQDWQFLFLGAGRLAAAVEVEID